VSDKELQEKKELTLQDRLQIQREQTEHFKQQCLQSMGAEAMLVQLIKEEKQICKDTETCKDTPDTGTKTKTRNSK